MQPVYPQIHSIIDNNLTPGEPIADEVLTRLVIQIDFLVRLMETDIRIRSTYPNGFIESAEDEAAIEAQRIFSPKLYDQIITIVHCVIRLDQTRQQALERELPSLNQRVKYIRCRSTMLMGFCKDDIELHKNFSTNKIL